MPFKKIAALSLAGLMSATFVTADGHAEKDPAVVAREAHMQLYQFNIGILGNMAQGNTEYDAAAAQIAADNLAAIAALDESQYWVEGTAEGSRALPAIWENMDDFMTKQEGMATASAAMASVAGTDLASLQGAMGDLGGACSACHREYRQRN